MTSPTRRHFVKREKHLPDHRIIKIVSMCRINLYDIIVNNDWKTLKLCNKPIAKEVKTWTVNKELTRMEREMTFISLQGHTHKKSSDLLTHLQ